MSQLGYNAGKSVENNVSMFVERNAEKFPGREVLKWVPRERIAAWSFNLDDPLQHDSLSMGEFAAAIRRVAAGFAELGIRNGDRAIVFVPMSVSLYVAMSALQRIGAIPVFLDSWARRGHLGVSADVVTPKALISFQQAFQLCAQVPQLDSIPLKISVGPMPQPVKAALEELMRTPREAPVQPVEREQTALVTFTTGSSGTPKGANRTHRFLAAQHYALKRCLPYQDDDVDLPLFPIFSLNNIATGVTTVIPAIDVGAPNEKDPLIVLAQLRACNVTTTTLSPSHFNAISAHCIATGSVLPLRRAVTGGAPISRDNLIDFARAAPEADVWVLYGSTEVEPMAHIEAREMIGFKTRAMDDPEWVDDGVNVGHLDDGLQARFLAIHPEPISPLKSDDDWKTLEVKRGEIGEVIVAGEHVCRDYYNDKEAFEKAKIVGPDGIVWHRTGDLGRLDADGYLWIVGRIHNVIRRGGGFVHPVRAELVLKKLPFVSMGAFLGMPDALLGERAVCVVVPYRDDAARHGDWEKEIHRIFARHDIPVDGIVFRQEIPMDPRHHSKVEYGVLRRELLEAGA
jgi:acyl-CoA synthetase (AMP-forming)/AMP-acid ligase II